MSDTSKSPSTEVEQLRNQLDELRASDPAPILADAKQRAAATVSNVAAQVTDSVATPVRHGMERVRGAVDGVRRTAAEVDARKQSLSQQIRSKPLAAVGLATLTGYVFGRIVR